MTNNQIKQVAAHIAFLIKSAEEAGIKVVVKVPSLLN